MFTKRIIPCLDVNKGRVVKGVNFVDLKDAGDPVEIAKAYDAAGADELVFLDITASCEERDTVVDMVRAVAANVFIPFTVGGGIRTVDDFRKLLREGALMPREGRMAAGISTNMAEDWIPVLMLLNGRRRWKNSVQVRSFLPAWTATEQKQDTTLNLQELLQIRFPFL